MNRPGLAESVVVALLGAALTPVLAAGIALVVPAPQRGLWLCLMLGLVYGVYLSARGSVAAGRLLLITAWLLTSLFTAVLLPAVLPQLLVQLAFIWVARVWFYHTGPVAALLDAGLLAFGIIAGFWTLMHTNSLLLTAWTWLLIQGLFVLIPPSARASTGPIERAWDFSAAANSAERALSRFASRGSGPRAARRQSIPF